MKLPKIPKSFVIVGLATLLLVGSYYWFSTTPLFGNMFEWSQKNIVLFVGVLLLLKFASLAYPPLPGGVFTLAAVPLIGWELAFAADITGAMLGGIFNYFLAKKYGLKFINKMFGQEWAVKVQKIKIKKGKEIESLVALRLLTGSVVLEAIHYAAGILKVDFNKYLIAMLISHLAFGVPMYYLASKLSSGNIYVVFIVLAVAIPVLYKLRGRYFEVID